MYYSNNPNPGTKHMNYNFLWNSETHNKFNILWKLETEKNPPTPPTQIRKHSKAQDLNLNLDQNIIQWNC